MQKVYVFSGRVRAAVYLSPRPSCLFYVTGEAEEALRDSLPETEAKLERERKRARPRLREDEMADGEDPAAARRRSAITDYRKKLLNCRELESRVGTGEWPPLPPLAHPPRSIPVSLGFGAARFPPRCRGLVAVYEGTSPRFGCYFFGVRFSSHGPTVRRTRRFRSFTRVTVCVGDALRC